MKTDAELIAEYGSTFKRRYDELRLAGLEDEYEGQYVVIHVITEKYVIGPTRRAALKKAEQEFGSSDYCWSTKIGVL